MWLTGKAPVSSTLPCLVGDQGLSAFDLWALSDDEDVGKGASSSVVSLALADQAGAAAVTAGVANPSSAYAEFNKRQRGKATRWFASDPVIDW